MIYFDDFIFLLGADFKNPQQEFLIQTKGIEIKNCFKVHHEKVEVLKKSSVKKVIVTMGYDDI